MTLRIPWIPSPSQFRKAKTREFASSSMDEISLKYFATLNCHSPHARATRVSPAHIPGFQHIESFSLHGISSESQTPFTQMVRDGLTCLSVSAESRAVGLLRSALRCEIGRFCGATFGSRIAARSQNSVSGAMTRYPHSDSTDSFMSRHCQDRNVRPNESAAALT